MNHLINYTTNQSAKRSKEQKMTAIISCDRNNSPRRWFLSWSCAVRWLKRFPR